jgi:hypothetical protein
LPQVPSAAQVWTPLSVEHWVLPGEHPPEQTPSTQAWFPHGRASPQFPLESHVWTPLVEEQRFAPGVHSPSTAPSEPPRGESLPPASPLVPPTDASIAVEPPAPPTGASAELPPPVAVVPPVPGLVPAWQAWSTVLQ